MRKPLIAVVAAGALVALPAGAIAHPGNGHANGHGHGHANGHSSHGAHPVTYVFKGSYAGDGSVDVSHGNAHVRHADLVGTNVQFDLANARLTVADTNADGTVDASDVVTGDAVVVKARLAKPDPGAQPFAAKHLVDQTNPAD